MSSRHKARQIALQALYSWDINRVKTADLCRFDWVDGGVDTDFARLIVTGVIEQLEMIDTTIRAHLQHWDFDRIHRVDLAILRLSLFFLLFQPAVPATVTIDEAIELAKEFSTDDSYRFINGVLDAVRRSQTT